MLRHIPGYNAGVAEDPVAKANNKFAFDLYGRLQGDNVFFSPYSISAALAMVYEGAKGRTAEEIADVFGFPEPAVLRESFAATYAELNAPNKAFELHTANALWAQQDYKFLEDYLAVVKEAYGGQVTNLDFVQQPQQAVATINAWVEKETKGKIPEIITLDFINTMTRLILTNAIYFKGNWESQFDPQNTRKDSFRTSKGSVQVPMMNLCEAPLLYGETDKLQVLGMPYEKWELSMMVLLPKTEGVGSLAQIGPEELTRLSESLRPQEVKVTMPKFTFRTEYDLAGVLADMGMDSAFSDTADFSGMDGTRNLYISDVVHKAFVDVNEKGTEAAAATAVGMRSLGISTPPVFRADHQFMFIIQQRNTGNILFLGRVDDPS